MYVYKSNSEMLCMFTSLTVRCVCLETEPALAAGRENVWRGPAPGRHPRPDEPRDLHHRLRPAAAAGQVGL